MIMETCNIPKGFVSELSKRIRRKYPKSKGYWHYNSLVVKPFRSAPAVFLIGFYEESCIIREDSGFDWDAKGSNTSEVYFPPKKRFETVDDAMKLLDKVISFYINDEKEFYEDGLRIEREWCSSEGEAKELAGIIYSDGFLKELGII